MKKIVSLVLALCLVFAVATAFAAVNITVTRDNSYEKGGSEESGNREYTYYQIFRATEATNHESTGGGYDTDGTPGNVTTTPNKEIAYYLDASTDTAQIAKLNDAENVWFKLTKTADGSRYNVEWKNANTDTDTAQAAAQWLIEKYTALKTGKLTPADDGKTWTASDLPEGYYLLQGETGQNLIAATTDINVKEKNSYPTIDKKQKDSADGTYKDDPVNVKVGDTIYYQVAIDVPADANQDIIVTDTMSTGLTYDTSVNPAVKVGENDLTADVGETKNDYKVNETAVRSWKITIHPTANTKGKTVVITFNATINNDALVTIDRKNDVELTYGNYYQKDTVEHDIGAAAIVKYDGATADLDSDSNTLGKKTDVASIKYLEASFKLTANGTDINVKEATAGTKGVYVVDTTATSNVVTSDKAHNGVILIYGLDPDVEYTLTETATEDGYNMLTEVTKFKPSVVATSSANGVKVLVAEAEGIYAGKADADENNVVTLNAKQVAKVANNQGTVLPSTGGIGTTIFYILGGLLVVGAAVILVARRKAQD